MHTVIHRAAHRRPPFNQCLCGVQRNPVRVIHSSTAQQKPSVNNFPAASAKKVGGKLIEHVVPQATGRVAQSSVGAAMFIETL